MTTYTPPDDWSPADHPDSIAVTEGGWWLRSVGLSARRIREGRGEQQQIDARHLMLALRQLMYAAELQATVIKRRRDMPSQVHGHLKAARKRFQKELPGLIEVRDRLVHFSEHARGIAPPQQKITSPDGPDARSVARDMWFFGYDPTTGLIASGRDHQFDIDHACREAVRLNQAIWWAGHVFACKTPAATCPACRGVRE